MRLEDIEANLTSMAELARAHEIKAILASVLPVNNYTPESLELFAERSSEKIVALNRWIKDYCAANHLIYLDYFDATVDDSCSYLPQGSSHPNAAGYKVMAPLAERAIKALLEK